MVYKWDTELQKLSGESKYEPMTAKSLDELALLICENRVFGSWDVHKEDASLLGQIFVPLVFMTDLARKAMIRDAKHFYQLRSLAEKRVVKSYPCFFSCNILNGGDAIRLQNRISEIRDEMDS